MGVVNNDRTAIVLGDELQPAGHAGQLAESFTRSVWRLAGCDRQTERGERVHCLELADQWQLLLSALPERLLGWTARLVDEIQQRRAELRAVAPWVIFLPEIKRGGLTADQ